ncbi:mannosyltransferase [Schizopora paradoxa]|uniref:Alpha-1,3/1,6-mannosyltransferase ALG2 n=1 Tax=Schizopora paradoxa TaxID=27342 RepID=A0A0H2S6N5_9AGAM|nr:mannosyltransferase [Schizopora paradoxa]
MASTKGKVKLRVAFIHPDLGIGGAERLVVDAALGLQKLGHSVDMYTSHHDPAHCFEETRDGTLRVHHIKSPFPRSIRGKFHILFAHLRQLHLTAHLLNTFSTRKYDIFFVDQLSTCIPFLRTFRGKRVVFYVHFPDKLLADGEFNMNNAKRKQASVWKRLYRLPMDVLEEKTTGQADVLLANSEFTAGVFNTFFSIPRKPRVVYPGINLTAYAPPEDMNDEHVVAVNSERSTLLSLNRFEKKKNAALAMQAFAIIKQNRSDSLPQNLRLVLAGGYDPRLQDNVETLQNLVQLASEKGLHYWITSPTTNQTADASASLPASSAISAQDADVNFLLNFTTAQRSALLTASSTLVLLYTPANEHFGIGPVEGMACGLPVLACDSGGPTESLVTSSSEMRTGWLCPPVAEKWAEVLQDEILAMTDGQRKSLAERAKKRVHEKFGMDAMASGIEEALYDAVSMGNYLGWLRYALVFIVLFVLPFFFMR